VIPEWYPLTETDEKNYKIRTERNVIESDGTLILNQGSLTGGTLLTLHYAKKHQKPVCAVQLENTDISAVHQWDLSMASKFSISRVREKVNFLMGFMSRP